MDLAYRTKTAVVILALTVMASSCSTGGQSVYRKSRPLIDTFVTVTVVAGSKEQAENAIGKAFDEIERFGGLIDFFSDKSELSMINRNAAVGPVKVSDETLDVIEKALEIAGKSDGAFDPTIGPVSSLWDFHEKKMPSDEDIRARLPLVDFRNVIIDREKKTVYLRKKGMMLDLGGIAKGYAADIAVETLRKNGIRAGIVAVAGDIRTFGLKPDGNPWNVGIKNPRQTGEKDELIASIGLSDESISTSGDYERFFIEAGKRYHHLLDPRTGRPADMCRSVTVVSGHGVLSDGYSTAVFVKGPEEGLKLLRAGGMEGIIIDSSGSMHVTAGIKERVKVERHS